MDPHAFMEPHAFMVPRDAVGAADFVSALQDNCIKCRSRRLVR